MNDTPRTTRLRARRTRFVRVGTALLSVVLGIPWIGLAVDQPPAGSQPDAPPSVSRRARGVWVLDVDGRAVGPESFRRGLQTSGLTVRKGELWSVGDQRSQFPGHLMAIDPKTGRLVRDPIPLRVPKRQKGENPHFETYRKIPNSDFEGLVVSPVDADRFFAVTEDKTPWIASIRLTTAVDRDGPNDETQPPGDDAPNGAPNDAQSAQRAEILSLTEVRWPEGLGAWREDTNFRLEGLALSPDAKLLYLAFERAADDLPRILELPTRELVSEDRRAREATVEPRLVPIAFDRVPFRKEKGRARLNLNGLQVIQHGSRSFLLGVARDQERILVIDLASREVARLVDLDLRDPTDGRILWVSPEGIAADPGADAIWLVSDPDSVRGNYRLRSDDQATGRFAEYVPLLFRVSLSSVLPEIER